MSLETLVLLFLACGAMTFPLTLSAVYFAAALSPAGRRSPGAGRPLDTALSLSLIIWVVGALMFYAVALHVERRKPCDAQHTNQLTAYCREVVGGR